MAKEKEDQLLDIEGTVNKTEEFVEKNKKILTGAGIVILAAVAGFFGYQNFVVKPQEENARKEMFMAEKYFEMDSLNLALNGDGNFPGFLTIIEDYGASNSGNLAKFYAGVCYLKQGDFDNAISQLKAYKAKDDITGAIAYGNIGDAYAEQDNFSEAISYYKKAVDYNDNGFSVPIYLMKQATMLEIQGDYSGAKEVYEEIKKKYPTSTEGRSVDQDISRVSALAQ
ncbi:MAG: tetratricopeptide repeat protein [Bacteroidia bacterium]|nr:tetratricopeptide repeat protein [Bacteroidia bacterium]